MTFAEKLKTLRKKMGLSQENLADKLGVSRQAVTKWETDSGLPERENLLALAVLFGISIDELLSLDDKVKEKEFLYESITEYDIDYKKHFDIKLGGAKEISVRGYEGEKLTITLASNTFSNIQSDFKIKIDDIKKRIDVDLKRSNGVREKDAKESLSIFIKLPLSYLGKIEIAGIAHSLILKDLEAESIELDVKTEKVLLEDVVGLVEINSNLDMEIITNSLNGEIDINQIAATSKIIIPQKSSFISYAKGIATKIYYERDGRRVDPFNAAESENIIELNGIKTELIISEKENE